LQCCWLGSRSNGLRVPVTGFAFNSMRAGVNAGFSFDPTRATSAFIAARQLSQALHFHAFDESEMLWSRMPPIIIILRRLVRAFHVFDLRPGKDAENFECACGQPLWVQVFWCQWNMAAQALHGILDHTIGCQHQNGQCQPREAIPASPR